MTALQDDGPVQDEAVTGDASQDLWREFDMVGSLTGSAPGDRVTFLSNGDCWGP